MHEIKLLNQIDQLAIGDSVMILPRSEEPLNLPDDIQLDDAKRRFIEHLRSNAICGTFAGRTDDRVFVRDRNNLVTSHPLDRILAVQRKQ